MYEPVRGGTRGGQAEFKWTDVSADKDRENYLGHSINAPTGRWQKNKDIHWYSRDQKQGSDEQAEEIRRIKELEAEALAAALGFAPSKPTGDKPGTGANSVPVSGPSQDNDEEDKSRQKEERRRRKEEKKADKRARKELKRMSLSGAHSLTDLERITIGLVRGRLAIVPENAARSVAFEVDLEAGLHQTSDVRGGRLDMKAKRATTRMRGTASERRTAGVGT